MKLILCKKCQDVFKLDFEKRSCKCGWCYGYYEKDRLNAKINKNSIPLGFNSSSLVNALKNIPYDGMGYNFEAFVIPFHCPTIKYLEED